MWTRCSSRTRARWAPRAPGPEPLGPPGARAGGLFPRPRARGPPLAMPGRPRRPRPAVGTGPRRPAAPAPASLATAEPPVGRRVPENSRAPRGKFHRSPPSGAQARGPVTAVPPPEAHVWETALSPPEGERGPHTPPTCPRRGRGAGEMALSAGRRWGFRRVSAAPQAFIGAGGGGRRGGCPISSPSPGALVGVLPCRVWGPAPGRGRGRCCAPVCVGVAGQGQVPPSAPGGTPFPPATRGGLAGSPAAGPGSPGAGWWVFNQGPFLGCAQGTPAPPPLLAPGTPSRPAIGSFLLLGDGDGQQLLLARPVRATAGLPAGPPPLHLGALCQVPAGFSRLPPAAPGCGWGGGRR